MAADLPGLISVFLNHQTEAEKAALADRIAQSQMRAQQQLDMYRASQVDPAGIRGDYQANLDNANNFAGQPVATQNAYGMTTPGRTPGMAGEMFQNSANLDSGYYPSMAKAGTFENLANAALSTFNRLNTQHNIGQLPVTNQATEATNKANLATAKLGQSTAENMLGQSPLINASNNQELVNKYAGELWQPTARPGMTQSYGMTPEGAITRRYGQAPMSFNDALTSQFLNMTGSGYGNGDMGMIPLGGGKHIPTVIGQVPGMQSRATMPAFGTPMLDYMGQAGNSNQVQNTSPTNATQGFKPAYGTLGGSLGGSDYDATPTATSPAIGATQALNQLGVQLDENGQLQIAPQAANPYSGPYTTKTVPTPEQIRQAQIIMHLVQQGKLKM